MVHDLTEFRCYLSERFECGFAQRVARMLLGEGDYAWPLALAGDPDPRIVFRASYALEAAFFSDPDPEAFTPYLPAFLEAFLTLTNSSAQRHYTKMMAHLLFKKRLALTPEQAQSVGEVTYDRLIAPDSPVAVRVWAMDLLVLLSPTLPWVEEQLYDTIQYLMQEKPTPGLLSHGAKVCRALRHPSRSTV